MLGNPVHQGLLKTNIPTRFFRLDPLMTQNFVLLRLKLPIQRGLIQRETPAGQTFDIIPHGIVVLRDIIVTEDNVL